MKKRLFLIVAMIFMSQNVWASNWEDSSSNWKNSENNWKNSPNNWKNSPHNWKNSPYNSNRKNTMYDENGNSIGYTTKKAGGGVNIYKNSGKRIGYSTSEE